MNYIITKKCNKGCPYCFAMNSRNDDPTSFISVEEFKKLLDKDNDKGNMIKLLGGEPTQHPYFRDIVNSLIEKGKGMSLISNFLFREEVLDIILDAMDRTKVSFLVNSTNLDEKNRIGLWSKNYTTVFNKLYSRNLEEVISAGITIEEEKGAAYYYEYLTWLLKSVPKIERLRVSINFPGQIEDKDPYRIINNKNLGEIFLTIIQFCLDNYILPSLDCVIYPCIFNNKEELKVAQKFMQKYETVCSGSPSDLFPDRTISHCYPLKESIKVNYDKYRTSEEAVGDLTTRYKVIEGMIPPPEECLKCLYFKMNACKGPSLCFYDLSNINVGINI